MISGRALSPEAVVWAYLVQEHSHKGILGPVLDDFPLTGSVVPSLAELRQRAGVMPGKFQNYGDAVRQTIEKHASLSWTECVCDKNDVGAFLCSLPGTGERALNVLAALWPSVRTADETNDHAVLVGKLQTGQGVGPTIVYRANAGLTVGDGKHRLFAFLEHAVSSPTATTIVYVGR